MSVDAQPAAPSAAPVSPSFADFEAAANAADRAGHRFPRVGDVPKVDDKAAAAPATSDVPADSSPAQPAEQATSDGKPASSADPTKKADSSPATPEKRTDPRATENRVPELLAERHQLRAELEQLRRELTSLRNPQPKPDDKPASSPAAARETFPTYDQYLEQHPDTPYEQYLDERADWRAERRVEAALKTREEAAQQEQARRRFVQEAMERTEQFVKVIKEAEAENPKFWEGISAEVRALKPLDDIRDPSTGQFTEQPTPYHWITQRVMESPDAPKYLKHFSDNPADLHRIARLKPEAAHEALIELRVGWKHKPAEPPIKHVTDAPPPVPALGKRPSTPTDPVDAALRSGNYSAYEAAANARDIAARR